MDGQFDLDPFLAIDNVVPLIVELIQFLFSYNLPLLPLNVLIVEHLALLGHVVVQGDDVKCLGFLLVVESADSLTFVL